MGWGQGRAWPMLTGERGHYELAAGRDPKPYIKAMEQFASIGRDAAGAGLGLCGYSVEGDVHGRPAGSAQPLVWAHAEYLKLLRSAVDGQVFDRISVVEERYGVEPGKRTFTNHIEIFEVTRPVSTIFCGNTLRIVDPRAFSRGLHAGQLGDDADGGVASGGVSGIVCGYCDAAGAGGHDCVYAVLAGAEEQERWLGRNIDVSVMRAAGIYPAVERSGAGPSDAMRRARCRMQRAALG